MENTNLFIFISILENMKHKKNKILLVVLILLLFVINYNFIDNFLKETFLNEELVEVERVIDGDTVVVNASSVRLLGINSPEKGEILYEEAKNFLEEMVLNKSLRIERRGFDRYDRELAYLFDDKKNINLEIVKNGFGNYYFPEGKDRYYKKFVNAWKKCIENNINLCEISLDECAECIKLENFEYNENVVLKNVCKIDCNLSEWTIKDEGRKKFVFRNFVLESSGEVEVTAKDFNEDYVWTKTGDTILLRDDEGKLVLWEKY